MISPLKTVPGGSLSPVLGCLAVPALRSTLFSVFSSKKGDPDLMAVWNFSRHSLESGASRMTIRVGLEAAFGFVCAPKTTHIRQSVLPHLHGSPLSAFPCSFSSAERSFPFSDDPGR